MVGNPPGHQVAYGDLGAEQHCRQKGDGHRSSLGSGGAGVGTANQFGKFGEDSLEYDSQAIACEEDDQASYFRLAQQLPGETIRLALSREEVFFATRVRHGMAFDIEAWARADGTLVARRYYVLSNQGAYASHGHGVAANALNAFHDLYQDEKAIYQEAATVYTNGITAGAMRGYGIPQGTFAAEAHMDDVAAALGMDPIALRLRNLTEQGFTDPATGITCHSNGLRQCLEKGARYIDWQAKRAAYSCQQGSLRRGVGMAAFCYKTGVYPISLETASARLVLNQDGSCQLQLGATEIGQGADTVFCQIAAAAIGMNDQGVHIVTVQDTDVAPFDP
ncbi:MAG: molybdopterin cofactor-binding domain-containing protein, partial [Clostridiales bacterium]